MFEDLLQMMEQGHLEAADTELVSVGEGACSKDEAMRRVKEAIDRTQ